ncbi:MULTISPECIES: Rieske 2Fe-2S domain-containing protein [Thermomonospora]|uniref:Nitrite reductase/ring-hydroxylating ferredoxin subunit/uncharacterized membrane protein n=1 Tax=Thermomonospora cellulosilytica TaxID=1411118 RepID=A0A7W3R710_9ACTN|nr:MULTISPECIES: Rieske (2Fe-2S) protein [Thermomonospora]MBA9001860.1 nitrite reductase/ring-hydroxylating ferredoxin subunit/uncharacterized membrane protein [Thermomonospora cellulosilytica]
MSGRASKLFRRGTRRPGSHPADVVDGLEHVEGLDGGVRGISAVISRVLRPGPVKDALHGVPMGHPAHPSLTDVPMGCWMSAAVLDLMPGTERAARTLVAAGLAGALPTVLTGWTDWSALHRGQKRVGLVHASATGAATVLYAASLVARRQGRTAVGRMLGFAGLSMLMGGGYLGGHLAFRLAAGANHADKLAHLVSLGWHDLCKIDELPDGWPVQRQLGYINLFVLRQGEDVHILADRCAHLGGPLHQGRIVADESAETCVVCPWHGSTFRVADGAVVHGPATSRQPAFETRTSEEGVVQVRPVP